MVKDVIIDDKDLSNLNIIELTEEYVEATANPSPFMSDEQKEESKRILIEHYLRFLKFISTHCAVIPATTLKSKLKMLNIILSSNAWNIIDDYDY